MRWPFGNWDLVEYRLEPPRHGPYPIIPSNTIISEPGRGSRRAHRYPYDGGQYGFRPARHGGHFVKLPQAIPTEPRPNMFVGDGYPHVFPQAVPGYGVSSDFYSLTHFCFAPIHFALFRVISCSVYQCAFEHRLGESSRSFPSRRTARNTRQVGHGMTLPIWKAHVNNPRHGNAPSESLPPTLSDLYRRINSTPSREHHSLITIWAAADISSPRPLHLSFVSHFRWPSSLSIFAFDHIGNTSSPLTSSIILRSIHPNLIDSNHLLWLVLQVRQSSIKSNSFC